MTRTDRILATEIGDYPPLDLSKMTYPEAKAEVYKNIGVSIPIRFDDETMKSLAEQHLSNMRDHVKWYLNMLVLPPQGTVNNSCQSARHGVAYRSVNKTNKAR